MLRAAVQWRLTLGLALLTACGDPTVTRPDGGFIFQIDASVGPPPTPTLDAIPPRIPYDVVTIRGRAMGARVFVEGIGSPVSEDLLPGGEFCVDVRLAAPGSYTFSVFAQHLSGPVSEPTTPVTVLYDPSAPEIPNAQTCSGADPKGCSSMVEICGNLRDDDCNNLIDDRDPTCATCQDDLFEDNDDPSAPRIDLGSHDGLQICPGDADYYGLALDVRDVLTAEIGFSHAEGDLDLELLAPNRATVVARSTSLDDGELITYTATTPGEYKVVVYGGSGAANGYSLDLAITPGR
jgi:hypothetical protein